MIRDIESLAEVLKKVVPIADTLDENLNSIKEFAKTSGVIGVWVKAKQVEFWAAIQTVAENPDLFTSNEMFERLAILAYYALETYKAVEIKEADDEYSPLSVFQYRLEEFLME